MAKKAWIAIQVLLACVFVYQTWVVFDLPKLHLSDVVGESTQRKIDGQIWIWRMQWWATSNNWNRD
jgi:hypothetical protein